MHTIQHDTRSLRQIAIQRYLRSCERLEKGYRRQAFQVALMILIIVLVAALAAFISHRTGHI